ncbi:bifunctional 3-(3-hydroxy-phenyl)propionate/3-hydroxycinnamic acid hydroxylase MhpA [Streptomyces griseorubiginosus]|uniref:bifunctional 3-(3-hydroxy-phenyl)propionate/3-hydroxycinnamic acid hydroxylase MhpA n=1 Tax=Streptomyces griseorubiginosus TaxID=67304 RepID=UPI001AD63A24|nr:bifunctional 3-(3-hydroxy-phenyl)propionate/3-hydroxycinnamic acid hydroxylase [Streptomyces griseorubiginosus]MBO4254195.1 bifunctional 3-(3-hydroxy-phenyl)propionate/3-hydroxycinnamic acid hydroxylase [Streptomyces griseorubiginosus]
MTVDEAARVPVVIVGAGPVGVTAALLLARHGVRSVVLERHRDIYPLPRAVAADDEIHRILQAAGVGEEFTAISRPAGGLRLLDARHRVMAEFRRSRNGHHGYPQSSMFDQPELERVLRDALATRPECELRGGVEVTGVGPDTTGPVRVTYRDDTGDHELWAEAVLGCDGANSLTREAIGGTWEDLRFEERWTVIDAETTGPVRCWEGVDQVCDPKRPGTFMRVNDTRYRWEFRIQEGQETVRELVAPWLPPSYDGDFEIVRETQYTFRARVADRWRSGRVFLLGDAAHLTPPFVGQGLCSGLRDAHNLTWKLARVLRHGADERLLATYESERRPHARHVVRLAVVMGWAMTGGQDGAAALRRRLLSAACRIPGLTERAGRDLSPPLTAGPLVRRGIRRSLAGTMCPQPWVNVDGRPTRLDELLGDSFTILTSAAPSPSLTALAQALGIRAVSVADLGDDGTPAAWLRAGRADAVLLRPDRVVLDVVPAGTRDFTDTAAWAPLLHTTRSPHPSPRTAEQSLLRSATP